MLVVKTSVNKCREHCIKGEAKEKLRVAKLMLAKGCYSLQEIVELYGLSIDNIEKLKNDMDIEKQA